MTATKGLGTYGNAVGTVTPLDHKMAQLGLVVKTAANTIRPGLFWDGSTTIVSGKANMSYDVRALSAVTTRGATAGAVLLANDATYNVVTTAAPGSNSRYDVVYIWQREYSLDGTDSNPVIGVVQGTAAASPTVPSLSAFPGAIELARILVPAGVTATNSGTTITQTAPFTATSGGIVPVRNTTERDGGSPYASASWVESQQVWLIDIDQVQTYSGSEWKAVGPITATPSSVAGTGVSVSGSTVSFSGSTSISVNGVFTSAFSHYVIYLTCTSASADADIRFTPRAGGTDLATTSCGFGSTLTNWSAGTSSVAASTASTFIVAGRVSATGGCGYEIKVRNPQAAAYTRVSSEGSDTDFGRRSEGSVKVTTSYDGFTITPSSGNITGSLYVVGVLK